MVFFHIIKKRGQSYERYYIMPSAAPEARGGSRAEMRRTGLKDQDWRNLPHRGGAGRVLCAGANKAMEQGDERSRIQLQLLPSVGNGL